MKKVLACACSLLTAVLILSAAVSVSSHDTASATDTAPAKTEVINVSSSTASSPDTSKILEARFLNMLNHNFVYNDSVKTVEGIVNESVIALLDMRDSEDESYISEAVVADYVFNMYGIEISDFSGINASFPAKDGFVYIIPRGFSVYNHEISSLSVNEDGSYTVKTKVTVSSHDSGSYTDVCETLFVRNETSQFGFNIVYSNIGSASTAKI